MNNFICKCLFFSILPFFFLCTNLETNAVFSKLGAEDIVTRYDKLLHEWKLMKDAEQNFKRVMGLDLDRPLTHCLDSIPPGMYSVNPLHLETSMQVLRTVFYTFPMVLTRRIWLTIKSSFI